MGKEVSMYAAKSLDAQLRLLLQPLVRLLPVPNLAGIRSRLLGWKPLVNPLSGFFLPILSLKNYESARLGTANSFEYFDFGLSFSKVHSEGKVEAEPEEREDAEMVWQGGPVQP